MNILLTPPPKPASSGANGEQRLVLHDVAWQAYEMIGEALRDRAGLRLTYDRGTLEIMTTSTLHELFKKRLCRLVEDLAEECGKPFVTAGNMTFRREESERGLEADDCFWIQHEREMRSVRQWDPDRDPPPDLAIEIEVSRGVVSRLEIYAKLRVPEVWRFDGETLTVLLLDASGKYQPAQESPTFPGIPISELVRFVLADPEKDNLTVLKEFRAWVREQLAKKN